jgi:outer membrane protein, heavy metal efflux system
MRATLTTMFLTGVCCGAACASAGGAPGPEQVSERLQSLIGHPARASAAEPALPPDVRIDDGLTRDEAVAIALWNSPAFQADLADLGIARAEVQQAGLLRNPVLSLLFPWGPKQLEATLRWPIDTLWQRPRRVAAARSSAEAVAARLTASGLGLAADAKVALIDLGAALDTAALAADLVTLARNIARLVDSRFRAGDISRLEAETAALDAERAKQAATRADLDVTLARNRLHHVLGLDALAPPAALKPAAPSTPPPISCGPPEILERDALAARPDLRAAELDIEAAGSRLGWEKSRVFSLVAILDANAEGKEGFEVGPGLETDFGLIDRNQPGVTRAAAELSRAQAKYRETRLRIRRDMNDAVARLAQASVAAVTWRDQIRPALERHAEQFQRAYEAGEVSYLAVLEITRRLNDARTRELEASAEAARAIVQLELSVGRSCEPEPARALQTLVHE